MIFPDNLQTGIDRVALIFAMVCALAWPSHATARESDSTGILWNEFKASMAMDAGQIVRGQLGNNALRFQPLNRNTVTLKQNGSYGDRLDFEAGLMGILWWPLSVAAIAPPEQRTVRVEPRVAVAKLRFKPRADTAAYMELGYFPYKYNPDAQNLGEYLYRSGTYPGVVYTTNGYQLMDHAAFDAYGAHFRFSAWDGLLNQDLNFFLEPYILPIGDITPAYEASLHLPRFQAGAGAAFYRGISFAPSQTRPRNAENTYVEAPASADVPGGFRGPYLLAPQAVKTAVRTGDTSTVKYRVTHRYTQRGVKLMGRAALDLGFLLPDGKRNPGDLRVFAEAAVLGLEDQPFYYAHLSQRIPVMFGMNVPTGKWLDVLSVQGEYYASRFDDIKRQSELSLPIWLVPEWDVSGEPVASAYSPSHYARDDWKWSVYARKSIGKLAKVHVQVADDHLRLPVFNLSQSENTLTSGPSEWYYLLRLECGI